MEQKKAYVLSVSVGFYVSVNCNETTNTIIKLVDKGSVSRKEKGGVYLDTLRKGAGLQMNTLEIRNKILDTLCKSFDSNHAINEVLSIVGSYYGVDRAYIIENSEDELFCTNTYEWCNTGIEPEIQLLQNVRYKEDLGITPDYFFKDSDLFLCKNIEELTPETKHILQIQNVSGVLFCAIRIKGKLKGYIGFDNCSKEIAGWSVNQEAVDMLEYTAHLMTLSLMDYRNKTEEIWSIQKAQREAEKANEAKTEFLSRMSHDMRTPMNGILGLVAISEDETDVAVLKEYLGKIKQSGEYLLGLINDTLDFQKMESGHLVLEPEIASTKDLVNNVLLMTKLEADKKNITVKMENKNADLDSLVKVDSMRMRQIFFNLLSNAVKFTEPDGTIKICFECTGHTGNIAHDVITITDTGIGMSKEFIEKEIFHAFSQEHSEVVSNYSGSGLGLSIVKLLVELMGGTITVESELGVGTKFTVNIDFERADESKIKESSSQLKICEEKTRKALSGKRILLAEDHPLNAEITIKLLKKNGCEVEWAKDGQFCCELFAASDQHFYNAILMDIRMPRMDGLTATRTIRALEREDAKYVPIIALTANAFDQDKEEAFAAGITEQLSKPINPTELYNTISKLV